MLSNMSDNSEMIDLYSKRILEFAGNIPFTTPLEIYSGTASRRSPMCGSNLQVWINVNEGKITDFSHDVKTCALGQASSSIIAEKIIGLRIDQVKLGRDQLYNMLTKNGPIPQKPFENLEVLIPAITYKNRHASIMLSFEAIIDAFSNIKNI